MCTPFAEASLSQYLGLIEYICTELIVQPVCSALIVINQNINFMVIYEMGLDVGKSSGPSVQTAKKKKKHKQKVGELHICAGWSGCYPHS